MDVGVVPGEDRWPAGNAGQRARVVAPEVECVFVEPGPTGQRFCTPPGEVRVFVRWGGTFLVGHDDDDVGSNCHGRCPLRSRWAASPESISSDAAPSLRPRMRAINFCGGRGPASMSVISLTFVPSSVGSSRQVLVTERITGGSPLREYDRVCGSSHPTTVSMRADRPTCTRRVVPTPDVSSVRKHECSTLGAHELMTSNSDSTFQTSVGAASTRRDRSTVVTRP